MEVGFFYWPFSVELTMKMAAAAERYGYDMIGVADTPGNAMDPWVTAALVAEHTRRPKPENQTPRPKNPRAVAARDNPPPR